MIANHPKPEFEPPSRSVIDALPTPVIVIDANDCLCLVNVAAEQFFQSSSQVLLRRQLAELLPFASPVVAAIAHARATAGVVYEYQTAVGSPRMGGERIVDIQTAVMADAPRFLVIMILERSVAHSIDRQMTSIGAARSASGMSAMLAHEIKNPLAGIRGAAQLLESSLAAEDRTLTSLICNETDRIRSLVDQMEVFTDERPLQRKPVNIHAVLKHVRQLLQVAIPPRVHIFEDYDPSLPPVHGNRDQLVQVFLNLAKNAAEAIAAAGGRGEIVFSTAYRPGVRLTIPGAQKKVMLPLEVCILDDGAGIPEAVRQSIFEPFVTTKPNGRGLGLALVAKIVRDHGGLVECMEPERGAAFRVLLPLFMGADGRLSDAEGEADI